MDPVLVIGCAVVGLCLMVAAGSYIARSKGRPPAEGAIFGLILGPLGLLIEVLMPSVEPPRRHPASPPAAPPRDADTEDRALRWLDGD